MASILLNSITFANYSATDSDDVTDGSGPLINEYRHLLCNRFSYWADDNLAHCYASLDYMVGGGHNPTYTIGSANLTITLTTTPGNVVVSTVTYDNAPTNRMSWLIDISDLPIGNYNITAVLSTAPLLSQTFTFSKTSQSNTAIPFPTNGLQIYPMAQSYLANTSYATHAAVPIPYNTLSSTQKLGLYEDGSRIPCQIEVVETGDQNNSPKWLHVYFNAKWTSGSPSVYLLKMVGDNNPSTGLSILDDSPSYTVTTDTTDSIWVSSANHRWITGQPIKFSTTGVLPTVITPAYPPVFDTNHIYFARVFGFNHLYGTSNTYRCQ